MESPKLKTLIARSDGRFAGENSGYPVVLWTHCHTDRRKGCLETRSGVQRHLDGENAIRVWRQYRGYSQAKLAGEAGISMPYLSQLESGKRKGSLEVLADIARALEVALEIIIPRRDLKGFSSSRVSTPAPGAGPWG